MATKPSKDVKIFIGSILNGSILSIALLKKKKKRELNLFKISFFRFLVKKEKKKRDKSN